MRMRRVTMAGMARFMSGFAARPRTRHSRYCLEETGRDDAIWNTLAGITGRTRCDAEGYGCGAPCFPGLSVGAGTRTARPADLGPASAYHTFFNIILDPKSTR